MTSRAPRGARLIAREVDAAGSVSEARSDSVLGTELPVGARCDDEGRNNAEEVQDPRGALLAHLSPSLDCRVVVQATRVRRSPFRVTGGIPRMSG